MLLRSRAAASAKQAAEPARSYWPTHPSLNNGTAATNGIGLRYANAYAAYMKGQAS